MPIATAPLYRAEYPLGLGLVASILIVEDEPAPPPRTGAAWGTEVDRPVAQLTVTLPRDEEDCDACYGVSVGRAYIAPELCSSLCVCGEPLAKTWGSNVDEIAPLARPKCRTRDGVYLARCCRVELSADTLAEAVALLRARAETELLALRRLVADRASRLEQRERALAAARDPIAGLRLAQRKLVERLDAEYPAPAKSAPVTTITEEALPAIVQVAPKKTRRAKAA